MSKEWTLYTTYYYLNDNLQVSRIILQTWIIYTYNNDISLVYKTETPCKKESRQWSVFGRKKSMSNFCWTCWTLSETIRVVYKPNIPVSLQLWGSNFSLLLSIKVSFSTFTTIRLVRYLWVVSIVFLDKLRMSSWGSEFERTHRKIS